MFHSQEGIETLNNTYITLIGYNGVSRVVPQVEKQLVNHYDSVKRFIRNNPAKQLL